MILVILCLLMIASCILLRVKIYRRKKLGEFVNVRRLEVVSFLLYFIYAGMVAYFVTDTNISLIYTFFTFVSYYIVAYISYNQPSSLLKNTILIFGIPMWSILFIKSNEYFLINRSSILFLISLPLLFLYREHLLKSKHHNILKYISLVIGIGIAVYIMLVPYDIINNNHKDIQEVVAEEYLIHELNILPDYVIVERKLRGKASEVIAYCSTNDLEIIMIYRNGKIESYQILE